MADNNQALFQRAQRVIPGGVNSPVRAFRAVGGTPRFITRAQGAYLWDAEDRRYIDYIGSWGPMILGHGHPAVLDAVQRAAARGRAGRVRQPRFIALLIGRIVLLRRVHWLAVRLVVPPGVAQVRRNHVRAGMDVAHNALAGRNRAREHVLNRVARFILRYRRVHLRALALVAVRGVRAGMDGRAVVRVDDVARCAAAGAIIARMIVRAHEIERRIKQPRLVERHEYGVGAVLSARPARRESRAIFRLPGGPRSNLVSE
jgi:hypothetical protein